MESPNPPAGDALSPPASSSGPDELSDLDKLRFDYAWKWFSFHADQRTKMFNFMLIGLGVFATGVVSAIDKHWRLEAAVLAVAASMIAYGFRLLDRRNKQLYEVALRVLIDLERGKLFPNGPGIASGPEHNRKDLLSEIREGRHRYLMPLVTWIFVLLFAAGAMWSLTEWWRVGNRDDRATASAGCCQPIVVLPPGPGASAAIGDARVMAGSLGDTVAIYGTGRFEGHQWWLLLAGFAVLAGGVAAFVTGRRIAGGVGVAVGVVVSAMSTISLPLKAEFHFDPKIDAKLAEQIDLRVDRLLEITRRAQPSVLASARFAGFGEGIERFDCLDAANRDAISSVNEGITKGWERGQQLLVLLVGSTDRLPLSPALRRRFESNAGLARARVAEVERCLDLKVTGERRAPEIIRLVTGPAYTPVDRANDDEDRKQMANDREVQAFVIGMPTTR